jgi:hypothetical protein
MLHEGGEAPSFQGQMAIGQQVVPARLADYRRKALIL